MYNLNYYKIKHKKFKTDKMESTDKETILLIIDLFISDIYDLMKAVFIDIVENKEKKL